jgi:hypothetical protein
MRKIETKTEKNNKTNGEKNMKALILSQIVFLTILASWIISGL